MMTVFILGWFITLIRPWAMSAGISSHKNPDCWKSTCSEFHVYITDHWPLVIKAICSQHTIIFSLSPDPVLISYQRVRADPWPPNTISVWCNKGIQPLTWTFCQSAHTHTSTLAQCLLAIISCILHSSTAESTICSNHSPQEMEEKKPSELPSDGWRAEQLEFAMWACVSAPFCLWIS